jgi:tetratricopeptide (TPR) repeat protein
LSRDPLRDEEISRYQREAQVKVREAIRLRDEEKPPRLSEAAEHYAEAYRMDRTAWKAGINAANIWMSIMLFEKAEEILEQIRKAADPGTEQKCAAELNLGVLWNRRYLVEHRKDYAQLALEMNKLAYSTFQQGLVERRDAESVILKNFAAYNASLGRFLEAIEWLKIYRGKKLTKKLLEGTFDRSEIQTMASMDPEIKSFLESLNEVEGQEREGGLS